MPNTPTDTGVPEGFVTYHLSPDLDTFLRALRKLMATEEEGRWIATNNARAALVVLTEDGEEADKMLAQMLSGIEQQNVSNGPIFLPF